MKQHRRTFLAVLALILITALAIRIDWRFQESRAEGTSKPALPITQVDTQIDQHAHEAIANGRQIFRFDTFGDEAFWGDTIKLHQAIQGSHFGGIGPGVSPKAALEVGLKVDVD